MPLEAAPGIAFAPERRRGRLRLRLREGADPLLQATGGRPPDTADPYRLSVGLDRAGTAEYLAEEVRRALLPDRIPEGQATAYLLPGPPVPVSVRSSDGTVSFDGTRVRTDWADTSDRVKRATGPRINHVGELLQVEWLPNSGQEAGYLHFVTREAVFTGLSPEKDPYALDLWGSARRDLLTALVATAVTARLPHPSAHPPATPAPVSAFLPAAGSGAAGDRPDDHRPPARAVPPRADHHDVLLRRLRELGQWHREGVLTDEEFAMTKAAVLRGF
ncbi:hypothetical protein GCM10010240_28790 [Streptomyces griseoviridis]|nr:hypothetical protein GCM10010240_28790 [Streptomyces griseoviridis]